MCRSALPDRGGRLRLPVRAVIYRSWRRRALFIAISLVVPVIANGFRALGIVSLGYLLGSAQAAATDHVLYGWLFFSIVILLLVVLGLPFREDDKPPIRAIPEPLDLPPPHSGWPAMALVVVLGAIGPLAGLAFDQAAAATVPPAPQLGIGECHRIAPDTVAPSPGPGVITEQYLYCGNAQLLVRTEVFSSRARLRRGRNRTQPIDGDRILRRHWHEEARSIPHGADGKPFAHQRLCAVAQWRSRKRGLAPTLASGLGEYLWCPGPACYCHRQAQSRSVWGATRLRLGAIRGRGLVAAAGGSAGRNGPAFSRDGVIA